MRLLKEFRAHLQVRSDGAAHSTADCGRSRMSDDDVYNLERSQALRCTITDEVIPPWTQAATQWMLHPRCAPPCLTRPCPPLADCALQSLGVVVRFGSNVEDLVVEGGRCRGVVLRGGERLDASAVVLAVSCHREAGRRRRGGREHVINGDARAGCQGLQAGQLAVVLCLVSLAAASAPKSPAEPAPAPASHLHLRICLSHLCYALQTDACAPSVPCALAHRFAPWPWA